MRKTLLSLTTLLILSSFNTFASNTPWVFTSTVPAKKEMLSIPRNAACRPLNPQMMNAKCVQYKMGYVCPQDDTSQFIISTYNNKSDCTKALKRARRLFAQQ